MTKNKTWQLRSPFICSNWEIWF